MIVPVILSGGSGTRLWPLSRKLYPKQYLPLMGNRTMLQDTVLRLHGIDRGIPPIVVCNEEHRFIVAEQFREINKPASAIILEPMGKNTAPAVALAALHAQSLYDGDPVLLIMPADHHQKNVVGLLRSVLTGTHFAEQEYLVTFGINPKSPETGFGYIEKGERVSNGMNETPKELEPFTIKSFVEKPEPVRAQEFVDSGNYCWNSGIFMFRASVILEELQDLAPDILDHCRRAYDQGKHDLDFFRINPDMFETCPGISLDYAVMEKTKRGLMVPLYAGWSDLGSWETLWQAQDKDMDGNVLVGDVCTYDVRRSYVHSSSRLVTAVGLDDLVIVETSDSILVVPRNRVQDIKQLHQLMEAEGRKEAISHKKVYRPWGSYESMDYEDRFQVKRITVKPGAKLSLQKHFHRAEHWVIVSGTAIVTRGDERIVMREDESIYIPLGETHRLENPGKISLELIEVQSGSYLGEDDIQRFDDAYGREEKASSGEEPPSTDDRVAG